MRGRPASGKARFYRVLSDADLLSRWKRSTASSGEYNFGPRRKSAVAHRRHVRVGRRTILLLVSFVDAYSRYIVPTQAADGLDGKSVAVELQAALEAAKDARPRVVHDHGSEVRQSRMSVGAVIKRITLIDIKPKPRPPRVRTVS